MLLRGIGIGAAGILLLGALYGGPRPAHASAPIINIVAATNVYGDVIQQLGGSRVRVTSILSNPTTDPHTYESSTADAGAVARATLVVQNGIGYDDFMDKLEAASPNARRVVIDVAGTLGYRTGDNPHIWYRPDTMARIAPTIADALARQDPADTALFRANLKKFQSSLQPWLDQIAAIKKRYGGTPVAVTEPVFDYAAQACGLKILTPYSFQAAIMDGNDPAPQDVMLQRNLFSKRQVKVFFYNQQAIAPITVQLLGLARTYHIPVVGVYETRPRDKSYQQWMMAETTAVQQALARGTSTQEIH